jgi:hypothetical protein
VTIWFLPPSQFLLPTNMEPNQVKTIEFLEKLAALLDEYKAEVDYDDNASVLYRHIGPRLGVTLFSPLKKRTDAEMDLYCLFYLNTSFDASSIRELIKECKKIPPAK